MTTATVQHTATMEFMNAQPQPLAKNVLDIGCGDGFASSEFIARGAKHVDAFDIVPTAMPFVKGLDGIDTWLGTPPGGEAQYDIVWCHHVLEHQEKPIDFLDMLRCWLKAEGELWLTVPHGTGNDVYSPGHLLNFNLPTLIEHLRRARYDVVAGSFHRQRGHVRAVVRPWSESRSLSPYPLVMQQMLQETGRCPGDALLNTNWPRA